jgi:WD40 repeat protein
VVATGGKGKQARLWDVTTAKLLGPPLVHGGEVHALAFDPQGRHLWTGSWDGTVRRWSMPAPRSGQAAAIRDWIEAHTGQRLDESGAVVALSLGEWESRLKAVGEQ